MLTREQLAERLKTVKAADVAREAGVSTKTVYRLRHLMNAPRLDVVQALVAALDRLDAGKKKRRKGAA